MADPAHIALLRHGVAAWNGWRRQEPSACPDLSGADLRGVDLYFGANFSAANLEGADLSSARLDGASFRAARLRNANLTNSSLRKTKWLRADARYACFVRARFHRASISEGDFRGADFREACLDVKAAVDANFEGAHLTGFRYETRPYALDWFASMLDLAFAKGLDKVDADSRADVVNYLATAFDYAHSDPYERQIPQYLSEAIKRIRSLIALYQRSDPGEELASLVVAVDRELATYFASHPEELFRADWRVFERLIAELLAAHGWQVEMTCPTKDGGYDIWGIHKDALGITHNWIVECKRWARDRPVGIEVVRGLYAVKLDLHVAGALLATTSHFTRGAKAFKASHYDLELKDLQGILEWLNAYRPVADGRLSVKDNRIVCSLDSD